jgi:hypothetical protein
MAYQEERFLRTKEALSRCSVRDHFRVVVGGRERKETLYIKPI